LNNHNPADAAALSGAASDAIVAMLRRRLLNAARDLSSAQDHLDCAELADAGGWTHHAEQLRMLARLRLGFAPEPAQPRLEGDPNHPIILAISELKPMLAVTRELEFFARRGADLVTPAMLAPAPSAKSFVLLGNSADAIEAMHEALRLPQDASVVAALTGLLDRLNSEILSMPDLDLTAYASGGLSQLLDAFAFASLQQFLRSRHDLAYAPFGSAELLHLAARLHPTGLGPYCVKASYIVRDTIDLLAVLDAAADAPLDDDEQDRWLVLLASGMRASRLHELADDIADLGRLRPLWGIFAAALRLANGSLATLDRDLLLRIRDGGLDNDDMWLAAEAQRIVASRIDDTALEWRILGDIQATAGKLEQAENAYQEGMRIAPEDIEISHRQKAMRSGTFTRFAVLGGYGWRSWRRGSHQRAQGVDA
jgi:tetratricopeptide (TPR) repeat protein